MAAGSTDYQTALAPYFAGASGALANGDAGTATRLALGSQFAGLWLSTLHQGWDVGLAPGPLTPDTARIAIITQLAQRFTTDQVVFLASHLTVDAEPFSDATLQTTQNNVMAALRMAGIYATAQYGVCTLSDAIRVEVTVDALPTAELQAQVAAVLAPFGDAVRFRFTTPPTAGGGSSATPPPTTTGTTATKTPSIASYVSMAGTARCVKAATIHVRAKPAKTSSISSLKVAATGARALTLTGSKLAGGAAIKLTRKKTKVTLTLALKSGGGSAKRAYTFTRCAR